MNNPNPMNDYYMYPDYSMIPMDYSMHHMIREMYHMMHQMDRRTYEMYQAIMKKKY